MSKREEMKEVIVGIYEYLGRLINGVNQIAESYQCGNEREANKMMVDIIDGIGVVIEGINATAEIQDEKIQIEDINEHFIGMVDAFENTDYVLLSDLLEYEIVPVFEDWREKIKPLIEG